MSDTHPPKTVATEPAIRVDSVTKQYVGAETVTALADVDLSVYGGEFLAIVGPSGSG